MRLKKPSSMMEEGNVLMKLDDSRKPHTDWTGF
ncbi:hypothetical protein A2U01_0067258 [Trifolium medium]|uniref:Uncharacterized protein n=1 Tax=Trifolium medium TaxID=97028 RepID=A0A392SAZ1_9FABA|nr:hypothetical protein [Trifolium medium]